MSHPGVHVPTQNFVDLLPPPTLRVSHFVSQLYRVSHTTFNSKNTHTPNNTGNNSDLKQHNVVV